MWGQRVTADVRARCTTSLPSFAWIGTTSLPAWQSTRFLLFYPTFWPIKADNANPQRGPESSMICFLRSPIYLHIIVTMSSLTPKVKVDSSVTRTSISTALEEKVIAQTSLFNWVHIDGGLMHEFHHLRKALRARYYISLLEKRLRNMFKIRKRGREGDGIRTLSSVLFPLLHLSSFIVVTEIEQKVSSIHCKT